MGRGSGVRKRIGWDNRSKEGIKFWLKRRRSEEKCEMKRRMEERKKKRNLRYRRW